MVKNLVEGFGERLQNVSLISPYTAEEIDQQYADYLSPDLLHAWMSDPTLAPGRMTSSPWPDHINISAVSRISDSEYGVSGDIIEVTSYELVAGEIAHSIPVHLIVQKIDGRWQITDYRALPE